MNQWKSEVGPRKTKAIEDLLRQVGREACTWTEITRDGVVFTINAPCGNACNTFVGPALQAVGDDYGWTITKKNADALKLRLQSVLVQAQEKRPVVDKREKAVNHE